MKDTKMLGVVLVLFCSLLASCTANITPRLRNVFQREFLNDKTSVQPIDLSIGSRCPDTRALRVVSKETRTQAYKVFGGARIIPTEYLEIVARYLEDKLRESNVRVNEKSGKEIHGWMEEVRAAGFWAFGCDVKLKLTIPEIGYTKIYSGYEGSPNLFNAIGYATNLAVDEFLNDPVVQKYIQCRE